MFGTFSRGLGGSVQGLQQLAEDSHFCPGPTGRIAGRACESVVWGPRRWSLYIHGRLKVYSRRYGPACRSGSGTERFAKIWDLQIDASKTITWGTSKLAPYSAKVRALKTSAWPKALYAVSTVQLGRRVFQAMRSGAMKGLNARKPGANPLLHLSLVEYSVSDPAFFALQAGFLSRPGQIWLPGLVCCSGSRAATFQDGAGDRASCGGSSCQEPRGWHLLERFPLDSSAGVGGSTW